MRSGRAAMISSRNVSIDGAPPVSIRIDLHVAQAGTGAFEQARRIIDVDTVVEAEVHPVLLRREIAVGPLIFFSPRPQAALPSPTRGTSTTSVSRWMIGSRSRSAKAATSGE